MILFNERKYVETILSEKKKPLKMSTKRLIVYLCRYYYNDFCSDKTSSRFQRFILDVLNEFDFTESEYEEYKFINYVKTICRKLLKNELDPRLKEIDKVGITKVEIENIRRCKTERQQKLLFSFYFLAKSYNDPTGWVNYSVNDIFKLANINLPERERILLIKDLCDLGFINYNHIINKNSYFVVTDLNDCDYEIVITKFENIGNQWIVYKNPHLMICDNCGRIVKRKAPAQRYCKNCYQMFNNLSYFPPK